MVPMLSQQAAQSAQLAARWELLLVRGSASPAAAQRLHRYRLLLQAQQQLLADMRAQVGIIEDENSEQWGERSATFSPPHPTPCL